jgi:hypothetical protein
VKTKHPRHRTIKRVPLSPDAPFTPDDLATLIADALPAKFAKPGNDQIVELCSILNFRHAWYYAAQQDRDFNEMIDQARPAVELLSSLFPKILENLQRRDAERAGQDQFLRWQLEASAELVSLFERQRGYLLATRNRNSRGDDNLKDWRWLGLTLLIDIDNAIRPSNPKLPDSRSRSSPIMKILSKVIRRVSGNEVSDTAVAQQLYKFEKEAAVEFWILVTATYIHVRWGIRLSISQSPFAE